MNKIIKVIKYTIVKNFVRVLISTIGFIKKISDDTTKKRIDVMVNNALINNLVSLNKIH
ncbi:hypothetical protein BJV85_002123 [Clostridium acetobutylicum]|uniref:Uncharacterized protein n=1 Tax=Clostridium acetobutylicum (strain ATCC 824 / DSM 792 / JCM 1419 / IAM 19013 / LMG 5710 / NBRC 13948 / NRRL B-527 / VKM B-1787 / 2291 / W) TaxID=272562 RepID=Q97HY3_CLOAB|nr:MULTISPECIES: hypothetical protein [Clostridium]AAK79837.1 Hypothetical protein CA_C1873 [Clostridium acetobutylicum ATCC 824]ADZ20923.1 Conserved hypothetical protein [Clostridium acetobutylicum EA 2018]AEI32015.1 hypothetical protein SMB_G1898 [Clostridium acetobutylicum DSM 1731]AWV79733.1 hypothetical protein DK921_06395 [Clostridium acetobutylicum]MBC2394289.1 hypothetical protein [Clostridium acetobutylicum]